VEASSVTWANTALHLIAISLTRPKRFLPRLFFNLMPIVGIVGGFLMLNEKIILTQVVGILIVIVGVYLINRVKFKKG